MHWKRLINEVFELFLSACVNISSDTGTATWNSSSWASASKFDTIKCPEWIVSFVWDSMSLIYIYSDRFLFWIQLMFGKKLCLNKFYNFKINKNNNNNYYYYGKKKKTYLSPVYRYIVHLRLTSRLVRLRSCSTIKRVWIYYTHVRQKRFFKKKKIK